MFRYTSDRFGIGLLKMKAKPKIEYPALVFKKNNLYVADCVMYNIAVIAKTEKQAVRKLERIINKEIQDFKIQIKTVN